jgi:hypothetical protein
MSARFALWRSGVSGIVVTVLMLGCVVLTSAAVAVEAQPFGITKFTFQTTEQTRIVPLGGQNLEIENVPYAFTQAGGHPWGLTTTFDFASEEPEITKPNGEKFKTIVPTRDPKDVVVSLPAGLLGNPVSVPRCPLTIAIAGSGGCPSSTQIGVYRIRFFGGKELVAPIVNLVPERGQSAEFALENNFHISFLLTAHLVRTAEGYGLTVIDKNIPVVELSRAELTFWGVPADPSHDALRGRICQKTSRGDPGVRCVFRIGGEQSGEAPVPFLSWPTDCAAGPEVATARADSWEEPGRVRENQQYEGFLEKTATIPGVTGCSLLSFDPSIEAQPDTLVADEPVGLGVNLQVPQPEVPARLATPHLRKAVVTLPLGMSVSPGVVDGIQACDASGREGINFTGPESEEVAVDGELQLAPGRCPDASIVGTAEAITPVLGVPVKGHVYLARPGCGGVGQAACTEQDALDGNLYQLYLELGGTGEFADLGIQIKVAGKTEANPATGQLTTVFDENPQTPFSELRIHLNGGPRAPIDNPAVCGPAVTTADFTPWSAPGITPQGLTVAGTPDGTPSSFFTVGGCSSPPPFSPGFVAGTVTPQAGQFSTFTLNISRKDREQFVKGIQIHTPPGLLGMLSNVVLCGEPQARLGTCPESSKIGSTRVATGAGSHPFEIEGKIYLTGGYGGAPFGLSIVTNAVAGPFNLGLVVVRARINVDPENSTLTVTTDETGPYALPQIVFGIPLRLQRITVNIDRPNFMFNPTNCEGQQITANLSGSGQAVSNVSSSFAVGGCKSLEFKPKFTVSTNGHTSRANGASIDARLSYPKSAMGNAANIARVKVSLPKQLPSRLTTLQKACPAATFNSNPAACPSASIVGVARATTPLLPVGLSGPVFFVSHGGEAFPSLIVVLQGDGVRVDLTGSTFIDKAGITSSTFKTIPDVPVNTFELYLPQGKTSALAANGNLCKTAPGKLVMPTEFVAQNGAVLKQNTKITVSGCRANSAKLARHRARQARRRAGGGHASRAHGNTITNGRAGR